MYLLNFRSSFLLFSGKSEKDNQNGFQFFGDHLLQFLSPLNLRKGIRVWDNGKIDIGFFDNNFKSTPGNFISIDEGVIYVGQCVKRAGKNSFKGIRYNTDGGATSHVE